MDPRREQGIVGLRTHLRDLDEVTGGLRRGDLIVVTGQPSVGKTIFALNLAGRVAMGGWAPPRMQDAVPVLITDLGVWPTSLTERMLSAYAGLSPHRIRRGRLTPQQALSVRAKATELKRAPIHMSNGAGTGHLCEELRDLVAMTKQKEPSLGLVVVDTAQLFAISERREGPLGVKAACQQLKTLAQDEGVCVLALTESRQYNDQGHVRLFYGPGLTWPPMSYRFADVVIIVHRDMQHPPASYLQDARLIVAKNRRGSTGFVNVSFQRRCLRFDDLCPV